MTRITTLKNELKKANLDGYLTTKVKSVYYFTGFMDISEATLILIIPSDGESILVTTPLSYVAASEYAKDCVVKNIGFRGKIIDKTIEEIRNLKMKNIGFDDFSISMYLKLVEGLKEGKFNHSPDIIMKLRRSKDEKELDFMRKAAMLTDIGAEAGIEAIKSGVHEYEVAAEIEYAMRIRGSEGTAFETVVASGPRSAYPHGVCSDRIIREGDFVILDLGAVCSGYRCDITRTMIVGKPSPRQSRMFNLILKAQEEAFQSIRADVKTKEVDAVARKVLANGGFGKFFIHGLGHGVGLDIHEHPTMSPRSRELLEERDVVTNEPGIYIQGFGGIRIEDTVLVHKDRGEKLTKASYYV